MKDLDDKVARLEVYTRSLTDFKMQSEIYIYSHMGALIVDAVLQAGINYDSVVKPRVLHIQHSYPEADTTSGFLKVLSQQAPETLMNFHGAKVVRILELACLLRYENLETTHQLASWIVQNGNRKKLMKIKGIKNKTVDYIGILCGVDTTAIDMHLFKFLENAGVPCDAYEEAQAVITETAHRMGVSVAHFDHSIWVYMSRNMASTGCEE